MEIIENALADGAGESAGAGLAEDSEAVLSVHFPEQQRIGRALSNADGRPSALCRVLQALIVLMGIRFGLVGAETNVLFANMQKANELLYVAAALNAIGFGLPLLTLESARVALQPGGFLEQLDVGMQRISAGEARRLARWRRFLVAIAAFQAAVAVAILISIVVQAPDRTVDRTLSKSVLVPYTGLVMPIVFSGWWPAC